MMAAQRHIDIGHMRTALEAARRSERVQTAYCVGAVLVAAHSGEVLATGFSRELAGNTHAEECALLKCVASSPSMSTSTSTSSSAGGAEQDEPLRASQLIPEVQGATLYTTMEPCSTRLSGKVSCTDRVLAAGIARVVVGVREPPQFVQCDGIEKLRSAGVAVDVLDDAGLVEDIASLNRHVSA